MFQAKAEPNHNRVLIVGVDDYSRYDPSGAADLVGAVNDAVAWWLLCVTHLRVPPEQITLLTTPMVSEERLASLDASGYPGVHLGRAAKNTVRGEARLAEIRVALGSMGSALRDGTVAGLFAYSGHGTLSTLERRAQVSGNLAICPADIVDVGGVIHGTVAMAEVPDLLVPDAQGEKARARAVRNLTVVLDACYTSSGEETAAVRGLGAPQLPRRVQKSALDRLLMACHEWEAAFEVRVGGEWRGAASWAFQSMVERWAVVAERRGVRLDASYGDLVYRVRSMVDVLGLQAQTPNWQGMEQLGLLPVLQVGADVRPGVTSKLPNAPRAAEQLEPDTPAGVTAWVLTDPGATTSLGWILSAGTPLWLPNAGDFDADLFWEGLETWAMDQSTGVALVDGSLEEGLVLSLKNFSASAAWSLDDGVRSFVAGGPSGNAESCEFNVQNVDPDWSDAAATTWPVRAGKAGAFYSVDVDGVTMGLGLQATLTQQPDGSIRASGFEAAWFTNDPDQIGPFATDVQADYTFDLEAALQPTGSGIDYELPGLVTWYAAQDPLGAAPAPAWQLVPSAYAATPEAPSTDVRCAVPNGGEAPTVAATPTLTVLPSDAAGAFTVDPAPAEWATGEPVPSSFRIVFDSSAVGAGTACTATLSIETDLGAQVVAVTGTGTAAL